MTGGLPDDLRTWVEAETRCRVASAAPIGRGASRRIWAVELDAGPPLVVREDTGTGPVAGTPLDLRREATVYRALGPTGLPVPGLRAVSPDGAALLLDRAPGVEQLGGCTDEERRAVTVDYAACLARLHALDPAALELRCLGDGAGWRRSSATEVDVELWQSIHEQRGGRWASPSSAVALRWLREHVPALDGPAVLCHGDAGPGNFLHEDGRVTALLDWEFAHLGDPHDDLAWMAVRNQVLRHPIDLALAYRAWRETSGAGIDAGVLEWFRALVLTRMLISCDAAVSWAGGETGAVRTQAVLRPYLALAITEALRRAGCPPGPLAPIEEAARTTWARSPVAGMLDHPSDLDDLGAAL